jgi:S-adenosylmethionine hydrolase
MPIITLTSDFGNKDYFVAATKAALISELKSPEIIDISHQISPFNLTEAAYIIKNAFKSFPKGTIHIIGVEAELTPENSHLAMNFEGHYFIGANNGIFSMICGNIKPKEIVQINIHNSTTSSFPVLDIFVKAAAHICRKGSLDVIGKKILKIKEIKDINPVINSHENQILGSVIYIDNYGNVITNISKKIFIDVQKNRSFTILARNVKITKIYKSYSDGIDFTLDKTSRQEDGKKLALFNSAGHLELSIYKSNPLTVGSASTLFGLNFRDAVTVIFD